MNLLTGASLLALAKSIYYLPFGHSRKFFSKEYFFRGIVAFGVPFSINFLSSPAFLDF